MRELCMIKCIYFIVRPNLQTTLSLISLLSDICFKIECFQSLRIMNSESKASSYVQKHPKIHKMSQVERDNYHSNFIKGYWGVQKLCSKCGYSVSNRKQLWENTLYLKLPHPPYIQQSGINLATCNLMSTLKQKAFMKTI